MIEMRVKKNRLANLFLFLLVTLTLIASTACAWDVLDGPKKQEVYSDWQSTNDWKIVEAYAVVVGDKYIYSPNPNTPVTARQAVTYGISYDRARSFLLTTFMPCSRYHKIKVRVLSTPSNTPIRFSDPFGFSNSQTSTLPNELKYALDTLWNFATRYVGLPLPSPWGLILGNSPEITVDRDSDLKGGQFSYNRDPRLMGADYYWLISTPVNLGWYLIDVYNKAEAGLLIISYTPYASKTEDLKLPEIRKLPEINLPNTTIISMPTGRAENEYYSEVIHEPLAKLQQQVKPTGTSMVFLKEADISIVLWADFKAYR
ncbi:MAG: hypothetical protein QW304_08340 [Thermoproteota archaeon]